MTMTELIVSTAVGALALAVQIFPIISTTTLLLFLQSIIPGLRCRITEKPSLGELGASAQQDGGALSP